MKSIHALLALAALSLSAPASAGTDYVLTRKNGVTTVESPWGSWTGYIATPPKTLEGQRHNLSFDFTSPDYFRDGNSGHFAIGIHGNGYAIEGRGVVLGNVAAYPDFGDGCRGSTLPNAVVFESYWASGNCVMGWSESPALRNGALYHLKISSGKDRVISYELHQYINSKRYLIAERKTYDYSANESSPDNGGWFIAEVFSSHDWTLRISNLEEWAD